MRTMRLWVCALLTVAGLSFLGNRAVVCADEDEDREAGQRLERLERQVHQLADRQAQCKERFGAMPDHRPGAALCEPKFGPQRDGPDGMCAPCPMRRGHRPFCCVLGIIALVLAVVHILLAVWVFTDIRKRGEGSGLFIVLALLIGIPGAALYMLARIGDRKTT